MNLLAQSHPSMLVQGFRPSFPDSLAMPSPLTLRAVAVRSDEWRKAWLWNHALLTSTADFFYEQRNQICVRCRIRYVLQYSLQILPTDSN